MSQHHPDPVEGNIETHPVKLAVAVGIGALGLIIGIIMLAHYAIGGRTVGSSEAKANSPEAIASRVAPVVTLAVDPSKGPVPSIGGTQVPANSAKTAPAAPVVAMAIPAALPAGASSAKPVGGKGVFEAACVACHGTGAAGAPKAGDKTAWAPRIAKGNATLYEHALKGFNAMPSKGGNPSLADADVKSAVDYMISLAK
jgi:cytochrome c5